MKISEQNYVDTAEQVIKNLKNKKDMKGKAVQSITTSKIRNLLAMTADIYNEVQNQYTDILSEEIKGRIEYLRVRFLYEAGREVSVKNLVEEAKIMDMLRDIKGSRKNFILFSRYMEALVAFHKYYGGKD